MEKSPYDFYNYMEFWSGRDYEDRSERIALNKFLSQIHKRDSLVDIGGGFGRLAYVYAPLFKKCLILDPAQRNLDEGRGQLKSFSNVKYILGTSDKIPQNNFDVALMIRVSHHLPELFDTFTSINKSLNNNGYFILEVANKIHFVARLRNLLNRNSKYSSDLSAVDIRSKEAIKEKLIISVNHHPKKVEKLLDQSGFAVIDKLSVSNFRHSVIKRIVPQKILLFFENLLQKPLASFYFGPSIFYLCKKV